MNIAISSLCFQHHISNKKIDIVDLPRISKEKFGVEAVELHQIMLTSFDRTYIEKVKESLGNTVLVDFPLGISRHSTLNFSIFSAARDQNELEGIESWIKIVKYLGSPFIKPDIGRAKANKEINEETIQQAIQGYEKIIPSLEREGIKILLENHPGSIARRAETILQIIEEVDSPSLRIVSDIGNFPSETRYQDLEKIAPFMSLAHIKTYEFDNGGQETTIDVGKCIRIFKKYGFNGFLVAEFAGREDEYEGTAKTVKLIKSYV